MSRDNLKKLHHLQFNFIDVIKSLSEESQEDLINYIYSLQKVDQVSHVDEFPKMFERFHLYNQGFMKFIGNLPSSDHIKYRDKTGRRISGYDMNQIKKVYPGHAVFGIHLMRHTKIYVNFNAAFYYTAMETPDRFQFYYLRVRITFYFNPIFTFAEKQEIFELILYYLEWRFNFFRKPGLFNLKAEMMESWKTALLNKTL